MAIEAIKVPAGNKSAGRKSRLASAKRGALATAGLITASNAAFWIAKPKDMNMIVKDCGGKAQYAMNFVLGLATFSAIGAGINTILNSAAKKVPVNDSPRAVN